MDTDLTRDAEDRLPEVPEAEVEVADGEWTSYAVNLCESRGTFGEGDAAGAASTIGALAREFGTTVRAIRFYEDRGLLQPRRHGSARAYGPRERLYLKMILKGKELGFTLSEIRDIITARAAESPARDFEIGDVSPADFGALGARPGGPRSLEAPLVDLAMALRPDQIVAQIDHLERQRKALDDTILALRAAHRTGRARPSPRSSHGHESEVGSRDVPMSSTTHLSDRNPLASLAYPRRA